MLVSHSMGPSSIFIAALVLIGLSFCASLGPDHATVAVASIQLQHGSIDVHASSLSFLLLQNHGDAVAAMTAAAKASLEDLHALSDYVFHKAKFAKAGSVLIGDATPSASLPTYSRPLDIKPGDTQFYVQFTTATDILTLFAFQKFTGRSIAAHVQSNLYVAIGDAVFAGKALRFPGVSWVQARSDASKISVTLQALMSAAQKTDARTLGQSLVAECWLDGCLGAATALKHICSNVYLHPTLIEAVCVVHAMRTAVSVLAAHVAVDHVDVKHVVATSNFGGRAILGAGINATSPSFSKVLSSISVSNSIIAVADSGVDLNNCFFYDNNVTQRPFAGGRVVHTYEVQPCERCGKCCISGISGPSCTNVTNSCGNYIDESAHGTHVCGTVAGQGHASVEYANGIANGSKIYFQDIENILDNSQCFKPDSCGFGGITDLWNLFTPAREAGACVALFFVI
jgi:subtilisin family serine protease